MNPSEEAIEQGIEIKGSLLARNTLLNLIGQAVPLLVGVATIPFIVRGLGTDRFGLLSLAWVVLGYFAIFDLGLGRATTKFVAEALGEGDEEQIPKIVWTSVTFQAILGLLGALGLLGITPLLVERILNIPSGLMGEAKTTFHLLALSIPVVLVSGSFRGVLEAKQRFDLVNAVIIPTSALTFLLPLAGILLGFKLPGIVALILVAKMGALIAFIVLDLHTVSFLRNYAGSLGFFPHLFVFGGWVTVSSIAAPTFTYLERFLIASFLSVGALTFYAAPYEIVSRVVIFPASIAITLFPAFSYYGVSNRTEIKELVSRSFTYLFFILVPILVAFVVFATEILKLWLGVEFAQKSTIIFQILSITFFLHAFAYVPFTAIHGLGRPDLKAKLDLIMLPIFVGLCWWLVPALDLVGAALAKLVVTIVDVLYLSWRAKSLAGLSLREMFGQRTAKIVVIALLLVLGVLALRVLSKSFLVDIAVFASFIIGYVLLFVKTVMDSRDKAALYSISKYFLLGGREP